MLRQLVTGVFTILILLVVQTSQDCSDGYILYITVDGSESINSSNFQTVKTAVKELVKHSITQRSAVRVGVVVFSDDVTDVITAASNVTSLNKQIDDIIYPKKGTATHLGIVEGTQLLLSDTSSVKKVMMVITDGVSDETNKTKQAASQAKAAGITLVAVGIDEEVRPYKSLYDRYSLELENIATSSEFVFHVGRFRELSNHTLQIIQQICKSNDCNAHIHVLNTTDQSFHINQTAVGETFFTAELCGVDKQPLGEINCLSDGEAGTQWGDFMLNPACNFTGQQEQNTSTTLEKLAQVKVNNTNIEDVIQTTISVTKNVNLTQHDLLYITDILEKTLDIPEVHPPVVDGLLKMYSKLLETDEEIMVQSQHKGNFANRILKTMDSISDNFKPTGHTTFHTETFWSETWDLSSQGFRGETPIGLQLMGRSSKSDLRKGNMKTLFTNTASSDTNTAIILPRKFLKGLNGTNIRLSMNVYTNPRLFSVSQNSSSSTAKYGLNSNVISAKILADGRQVTDLNGSNVTIIFTPIMTVPEDLRSNVTACGYWNFTGADNSGSWSTEGCFLDRVEDNRDVCVCNHLTNFAVLMDFYGQETMETVHSVPLSVISIAGLSLSIFGLSATLVSLLVFRKLRQSHSQQTLFNLTLAELCSWVVFLAGINQTQSHVGCIAVAALLHYFILASFMWMLAEAVLHYRLLVTVLGTYMSRYMYKTGIPCWGIPMIPVIIVLALDTNLYKGGQTYCWMSLTAFYFAFALPVGVIILCNVVLYVLVISSICSRSSSMVRSSQCKTDRHRLHIRESIICFVLLGLSWIFGFFAVSEARVVFQYIFCITSTLQGFFIFVFFVARKKVRESWRELCCGKKRKSTHTRRSKHSDITMNERSSVPLCKSHRNTGRPESSSCS